MSAKVVVMAARSPPSSTSRVSRVMNVVRPFLERQLLVKQFGVQALQDMDEGHVARQLDDRKVVLLGGLAHHRRRGVKIPPVENTMPSTPCLDRDGTYSACTSDHHGSHSRREQQQTSAPIPVIGAGHIHPHAPGG